MSLNKLYRAEGLVMKKYIFIVIAVFVMCTYGFSKTLHKVNDHVVIQYLGQNVSGKIVEIRPDLVTIQISKDISIGCKRKYMRPVDKKLFYPEEVKEPVKPPRATAAKTENAPKSGNVQQKPIKQAKKIHTYSFLGPGIILTAKTKDGKVRRIQDTPQFECKITCFNNNHHKCSGNCYNRARLRKDVINEFSKKLSSGGGLPIMFGVRVYSSSNHRYSDAEVSLSNSSSIMMKLLK